MPPVTEYERGYDDASNDIAIAVLVCDTYRSEKGVLYLRTDGFIDTLKRLRKARFEGYDTRRKESEGS